MGDAYRAEDMKLGRKVAIKVLPEAEALWAAEPQGSPMAFSTDGQYPLIDRLENTSVSDMWVVNMEPRELDKMQVILNSGSEIERLTSGTE